MAAIVGIHGIGQQFGGGYQLGAVWFNSIRDGLVAGGHKKAAEASAADDVRVAFFGDLFRRPVVQQGVLARVQEQVHEDTKAVIGHSSLGSVVADEYLCQARPQSVELLVTLGSPLGIPSLVFDNLTPAPVCGVGTWPGRLAGWVNVADPGDIVALRKELVSLFCGPGSGQRVVDRTVRDGDDPRVAERYLSTRQSGSALSNVLA